MIHAVLPYKTVLLVLAGVLLRDLWCWTWAKVWYRRRQKLSLRQAQQALQQRELGTQAEAARIADIVKRQEPAIIAAPPVPFPELLNGPLVIEASGDREALRISRQLIANFSAQHKQIFLGNAEEH